MGKAFCQPGVSDDDLLFRIVFQYANDAVFVVDLDRDAILDANPRACEMLGYDYEELTSLPASAVHPDEMPQFRAFAQRVFLQGSGWTDELSCLTAGGRRLPAEMSASVVRRDHKPLLIAMVRDISRRKEAEEALQHAYASLEEANHMLEQRVRERTAALEQAHAKLVQKERLAAIGEFAAGIVHEVRNPLSTVSLALEYAEQQGLSSEVASRLGLAASEAQRLEQLLEDILSYARPSVLSTEALDLGALVKEVVRQVRESQAGACVNIRYEACAVPSMEGDRDKLKQVLLNILLNACEACGEDREVRVSCHRDQEDKEAIRIRVHNGGAWIPAEQLALIKQPFFSTKKGGSGLGLAIVERIVNEHGGVLAIRSSAEGGTTLTVRLPLDRR